MPYSRQFLATLQVIAYCAAVWFAMDWIERHVGRGEAWGAGVILLILCVIFLLVRRVR